MKKIFLSITITALVIASVLIYQNRSNPESKNDSKSTIKVITKNRDGTHATANKPTIKIGALFPLHGEYQIEGEVAKQSLLMFANDLKDKNLNYNYEFIIEPIDAMDTKGINNAAKKLVLLDKVDSIISVWNNAGLITSETTKGHNILHISLDNSEQISKIKNNFNFAPYADNQVKLSLEYMKKLGYKNLAVLGCNNQWSNHIINTYKKLAKEYDINISGIENINSGTKDFDTTFEVLKKGNPDIYTLILETPEFEIARKRMLEKKIKEPVTTIEAIEYTSQPELFEGSWYVANAEGDKTFISRFKKFSNSTNTNNAAFIYSIAVLIVTSFEMSSNTEEAIQYLQKTKEFASATGIVKQDNNFFKTPNIIKEVKNNTRITLEE